MGRLHTWLGAARRSRRAWVLAAALVLALVAGAGGAILATRTPTPAPPSPTTSTRAVALGDSVPYGHGLHNPYLTPQVGLPAGWVSQGPSVLAYPSRVAAALGLTMSVRATNCDLTGDQLAVSGAVADSADNTSPDGQCPHPPGPARNLSDEITAADLAQHPARLVLLQDGADDIRLRLLPGARAGPRAGARHQSRYRDAVRGERCRHAGAGGRVGRRAGQPGPGHRDCGPPTPGGWSSSTTTSPSRARRRSAVAPRRPRCTPTWSAPG